MSCCLMSCLRRGGSAELLRPAVAAVVQSVPRRHRGNVMQHRKPRWIPLANSTLLRPPAQDFTPQSEHEQMNVLKVAYNERLSAIVQYLYEDYLIYSDVGEAAREAARREQKEHERLLEENQRDNQRVAALRDQRQKVEREQREKEILQKVAEKKRLDEQKRQETEELVGEVIEDMANLVTMENLVENIEKALDEPLDYEYAIDLQGHIYRGRYTPSKEVPPEKREKIPTPPNPRIIDLSLHAKQEESN